MSTKLRALTGITLRDGKQIEPGDEFDKTDVTQFTWLIEGGHAEEVEEEGKKGKKADGSDARK